MASQTASILVTDLVGSTELRVRVGEERAEALRRAHDRLLADAVTANDGTVVKFLGDGVLATFAGAADALAAAVAIQQATSAHPVDDTSPFELRVGISAGDITVEDGDCFGTPVVEASRLCAAAAGGQILAASLVQLLARGRGGHAFLPCGPIELKGLPEPVDTVEVRWERLLPTAATAGDERVPLPPPLAATALFPMTGRRSARETLTTRWKEALIGERRTVLVSGEPGIGKTRLVTELARDAVADGGVVTLGRCDEELRDPYRPFAEAVRHLVSHLPDELLAAHVTASGGELVRLAPELARRVAAPPPSSGDADSERLALFDAVTDLIQRIAARAPVLLVLDDVHWADRSSLLLLRHLLRATTATPLLVVATYRDTDLVRTHPLAAMLADLRRDPAAERLDLQGLDEAEVVALLEAIGGRSLDVDGLALARALQAETDGNPFFVGEVLLHLNEAGAIYRTDGGWSGDRNIIQEVGIPQGIREVIGRRISALPDDTAVLLGLASVLGAEFDASTLAAIGESGLDVDAVVNALEVACARSLVAEVPGRLDRYRFTHALVRQTLYDELPTNRRVRLHARAAAALADRSAPPTDVAHHFVEAAALGPLDDAIAWSRRAADEAAAALAYEQAIVHRRTAVDVEDLREPPDTRKRAELLIALGATMNTAGEQLLARPYLREAADLAAAAGFDDLHVEAALEFGGFGNAVDFADSAGVDLLDRVTPIIGPDDSRQHVQLLLRRSLWLPLTTPSAIRRAPVEAAVAMAQRIGDDELRLMALAYHVMDAQRQRQTDARLREIDEFVALAQRLRDPLEVAFAHWERLGTFLGMGRLRDASATHDDMRRDVEAMPSAYGRLLLRYAGGIVGALRGELDDAEEVFRDLAAAGNHLGSGHSYVADSALAVVLTLRGRPEAGRAATDSARATGAATDDRRPWAPLAAAQAGRFDEILPAMERWLDEDAEHLGPFHLAESAAMLAAIAGRLRATRVCDRLEELLLPFAGQWVAHSGVPWGAVDHYRSMLARGRGDEGDAEELLLHSIAHYDREGERPWRAHAAIELAQLLVGRGSTSSARRWVEEAALAAEELGLATVAARAARVRERLA